MHEYIGQNVLLTLSEWVLAPDCQQYRAIWGKLKAVKEVKKELQIEINRAHSNWFYEVGDFIIMGCQVKYFCLCKVKPERTSQTQWAWDNAAKKLDVYESPNQIYFSE